MPRKKKPVVEVLPPAETALMPRPDLDAMLDRVVRERVEKVLAEHGGLEFEPDFESREVQYEIRRRQTVFDRHKWNLYFEKWGCRMCGRKADQVAHFATGHCARCHSLLHARLKKIRRDYEQANPDRETERQIDRLTSKVRTAKALLGRGDK